MRIRSCKIQPLTRMLGTFLTIYSSVSTTQRPLHGLLPIYIMAWKAKTLQQWPEKQFKFQPSTINSLKAISISSTFRSYISFPNHYPVTSLQPSVPYLHPSPISRITLAKQRNHRITPANMAPLLSQRAIGIEYSLAIIILRKPSVAILKRKSSVSARNGKIDVAGLLGELGVLGAGIFAFEPDDGVAGAD